MKRLKTLLVALFCLGYIIWIKPEAQVGIFTNTPFIQVPTGYFTATDTAGASLHFKYKGHKIRLPYGSIAYWEVI